MKSEVCKDSGLRLINKRKSNMLFEKITENCFNKFDKFWVVRNCQQIHQQILYQILAEI